MSLVVGQRGREIADLRCLLHAREVNFIIFTGVVLRALAYVSLIKMVLSLLSLLLKVVQLRLVNHLLRVLGHRDGSMLVLSSVRSHSSLASLMCSQSTVVHVSLWVGSGIGDSAMVLGAFRANERFLSVLLV